MENKDSKSKKVYSSDFTKDLVFNAQITIQTKISKKDNNPYQVMVIGIENKKTGEMLNIHEVYIKENLRQIIEFIINQND